MGILQKKCRTTGKKALAYRGKGGQNTGTAFPALRLGVVRYLLRVGRGAGREIVQNAIFHGKRHDNNILKVKI